MMERENELSVGQWFLTLILLSIPLVNFILLLVWGFGAPSPRKNFALAILLFELIGLILVVVIFLFILMLGAAASSGL